VTDERTLAAPSDRAPTGGATTSFAVPYPAVPLILKEVLMGGSRVVDGDGDGNGVTTDAGVELAAFELLEEKLDEVPQAIRLMEKKVAITIAAVLEILASFFVN